LGSKVFNDLVLVAFFSFKHCNFFFEVLVAHLELVNSEFVLFGTSVLFIVFVLEDKVFLLQSSNFGIIILIVTHGFSESFLAYFQLKADSVVVLGDTVEIGFKSGVGYL
jgi:hypothetical protein